MASFTFPALPQLQLPPFFHCKHSSTLNPFKFHIFSTSKNTLQTQVQARFDARLSKETTEEFSGNNVNTDYNFGFSSLSDVSFDASRKNLDQNPGAREPIGSRVILKDRHAKKEPNSGRRKEIGTSPRFNGRNSFKNSEKIDFLKEGYGDMDERFMKKCLDNELEVEQKKKRLKKPKVDTPRSTLRSGLDVCSRKGDVVGAINLYNLARREGIGMGQYEYAVLLYLCSSAASGIVLPAKSGRSSRSLSRGDPLLDKSVIDSESCKLSVKNLKEEPVNESFDRMGVSSSGLNGKMDFTKDLNGSFEGSPETLDGVVQSMRKNVSMTKDGVEVYGIQVSDDMKKVALEKGFEIYNEMLIKRVSMNEAIFTSVARMAAASGDGDMAFDVVKQMKDHGVNPRLRSYGPALAVFCNSGDVEKAFTVEKHMLDQGICPEEPELEGLLKVSIEAGNSDNVYYIMHKLRTSVRQVSDSTANLIERWFKSKLASRIGKRKWDEEQIIQAVQNGGGGWHGKGWLGKGKWTVIRTHVSSDGVCKCCGERLATIDLDPVETENFAKSVAAIAAQRERNSSFQKFQKWLDYYGPFEAVVDAANIGLYSQRKFKPSKVNAVVNGIRQMLPSRKWPLIVLHNRRINGDKMDEPFNRALIEKWKNADALYATPTGSNDDWYWLYAAIKYRCLIVTNDEMRDHLFQLLGNDFFPKWKEQHQVRFSFNETSPTFRMPPPCSVVIQESEKGHWHIPIASELDNDDERAWLCCTRASSSLSRQDSGDVKNESQLSHLKKRDTRTPAVTKYQDKSKLSGSNNHEKPGQDLQKASPNLEAFAETSVSERCLSVLQELEGAEKFGSCLIDFQI